MPLGKTADTLPPALAIGHFFGWMGCFLSSICYGYSRNLSPGIAFVDSEFLEPKGLTPHPTALYLALSQFLIFSFLLFMRGRTKFNGQVFWLYLMLSGITRCIIEIIPGQGRESAIGGFLSLANAASVVAVLTAMSMLVILGKRAVKRELS
jgi:phosphatidylglycerol:prolipoprotein diacylglycerol transferase